MYVIQYVRCETKKADLALTTMEIHSFNTRNPLILTFVVAFILLFEELNRVILLASKEPTFRHSGLKTVTYHYEGTYPKPD